MKKINLSVIAIFLCIGHISTAQETIEKEVDEQVWKPFVESWTNSDSKTFNELHTDDVLRANPWGVVLGEKFKKKNIDGRMELLEVHVEQLRKEGASKDIIISDMSETAGTCVDEKVIFLISD